MTPQLKSFVLVLFTGILISQLMPSVAFAEPTPTATPAPRATFTPFPNGIAPEAATSDMIGQTVTVTGRVAQSIPSTASNIPIRLVMTSSSQRPGLTIVYWEQTARFIHGDLPIPPVGALVSVKGELGEHRGALQIRVRHSDQIRIEGYEHTYPEPTAPTSQEATNRPQASPTPAPATSEPARLARGARVSVERIDSTMTGNTIITRGIAGRVLRRGENVFVIVHSGEASIPVQLPEGYTELIVEGTPMMVYGEVKWSSSGNRPFLVTESANHIQLRME